ncbi:PREDICTED: apolipoprotein B-100-like [Elephantulus edwardii]|uniref:apolipoprotein B-100-like n=1 Tax=Elephantulus edwardii TaxID=28737 RepID=UPI0003F07785|nr:PREDICTED: apolipoprotein B-100-like [Elephantulus edwardii]
MVSSKENLEKRKQKRHAGVETEVWKKDQAKKKSESHESPSPRPLLISLKLALPALLLLLAVGALAQEETKENIPQNCPKDAFRFKHLRKYVYNYEVENSGGVPGTADIRSATKINCKVELEVPQPCIFILKTSQCTLKEMYVVNAEGKTVMKKTKNSDEFSAAMARNDLKFFVYNGKQVLLIQEKNELKHILNIKRGIISAFLVPPDTEEANQVLFLDTVYGKCASEVTFKTSTENVVTEISINRNLSECDHFKPIATSVSPLALIKGRIDPLSSLISSSQSCQYTLDSKRKHVSEAVCKEKHLFLPFSHKDEYGMMTQVTQSLKLEDVLKISNNFYNEGGKIVRLTFESTKSISLSKQADVALKTLQKLQQVSSYEMNIQRSNLFNKLVTELRGLNNEVLTGVLPKLIQVSSPITLQALVQCGQPHCYTHILQWLKSENANPLLIDVVTYLLALIPEPSEERVQEIFKTAKQQWSRATFYALSHVVNNYHEINRKTTQVLLDIEEYLLAQIRNDCTGNKDHIYLILRVIGNMGRTMDQVSPRLKSSVLKCTISTQSSPMIQKAAIQALRKMSSNRKVQETLLEILLDGASPVDKRLAAYLILMREASQEDINKVVQFLPQEKNEQVKNFVASHIANILNSEELYVDSLKTLVEETLNGSQLPTILDFKKFSRNYLISKSATHPSLGLVSGALEGNLIFDPNNYIPKESMLKATLTFFGFSPNDLFEIGLEAKGFEPTLEALFGKQGFFPDSVNKALYWVDGKVPDQVSKVLMDHFGYNKNDNHEQDMVNGIMFNVDKLVRDVISKEVPEAQAYLRILGQELGFVKSSDLKYLLRLLLNGARALQGIPQMIGDIVKKGSTNDLFLHYIFMDNAFELPTGAGLQLQVSSSGLITPGIRAGVKLEVANMQAELVAEPSVSVEFVTSLSIIIPDFAKSGVQVNTNFYHESGLETHVTLKAGQLKFSVPAPKTAVRLFSGSNTLHLISTAKTEEILPRAENRQQWSNCKPFFVGLNYCTSGAYSNASSTDSASYYPLTGDTRFDLELRPTGEVERYSVSATYELLREGTALVDSLKFVTQAEHLVQTEMAVVFKYNRESVALTGEILSPYSEVDLGAFLRVSDESTEENKSYKLTLDIQNQKITEIMLTGHVSHNAKDEGKVKGIISIPRLQAEARSEIFTHWCPSKLLLQMDSSATAYGSTISKKLALHYDEKKMVFEWNAGTNVDTKKVAANFPVDLSHIPESLNTYANSLLDYRIPQTDMTFRHMGSKLIVATNTWLQKASSKLPFAQALQDHLSDLKEINLQKMGLPEFHMPENLFLKSDGQVKYTFNKNSVKIEIPLPFGGKSSKDLRIIQTVWTPALDFKSVGFNLPSQEFQIPTFTIPNSVKLRVPLLGVLDLSTNVYSNVYNWSASYTGGNMTTDDFVLKAYYSMKANSVVDFLSYSVQGSGEATYDNWNTILLSCAGSLQHKFLDSNIEFSHVEKYGNNPASKCLLTFDTSSPWGPQMSAFAYLETQKKQHLHVREAKVIGEFGTSSLYTKGIWDLSLEKDLNTGQLNGESSLIFNSTYLHGSNQITGKYEDGIVTILSTSDLQDGLLKNTASLKYENYLLILKSDTNGKYKDFTTSHKVDLTFSKQDALLRSEYQADYKALRFFTLLSASLSSHGLELNADIMGTDKMNSGAHKATLRIGRGGMSTSSTTNLRYNPLVLENELNAEVDLSGASMKLITNGRFREHNAKLNLDGKASLTELSLGSAYQALILGVDSKHIFTFKINQEGLKLTNDVMGSYKDMKLDYTNSLNIAGLSLGFSSKLGNVYSPDKFYKQLFNFQLQPYSLVATLNNDLKYNALDLTNNGKLRLEPLKLSMGGNIKGSYQNNEIKHIYTISYGDLTGNYKADTVAKYQDVEFNHRLNTDISGLALAVDINTNYNSESLHLSNVFHSAMAPFTMTIDTHTNGNGKLVLWGEHIGQLYNKFQLKAKPLALTFSHDYKGVTNHRLTSKRDIDTSLDHKVSVLLTPTEQRSTWKLKTTVNKNEYSQDFDAYNIKDKVGMEFNGYALADLTVLDSPIAVSFLHSEPINLIDALEIRDVAVQPQEFRIVASVEYDKNQDVHTINLPFLEMVPEYSEKNRKAILAVLESIQRELKRININQLARKYRTALDRVPQQVNDYLNTFNWEAQVANAKEKLTAFMKNYKITVNDLQIALEEAKINLNEKLSQLETYVIQFDQYIKDNYDVGDLRLAIDKIIDRIIEKLKILDEHYHIRVNLIKSIHYIYILIENVDFKKTGSSTISWIENVDAKYQLRMQIKEKLQQLMTQIQSTELQHLAEKLKQHVESIDIRVLLNQLRTAIKIQEVKDIIKYIKDLLVNLIEDFKITEIINASRAQVHELIKEYDVDQKIQLLMDKSVQLAHQFKLKEMLQMLSRGLKQVEMKVYLERLVEWIDDNIKKLKALDLENFMREVNRLLNMLVKKLRSFNYNQFVDETNNKIREVTQRINSKIQALELPQKAEALKSFAEEVRQMTIVYMDDLKNTKIILFLDGLQDTFGPLTLTALKDKFHETLEDIRDRMYQMDIQQELQRYLSLISQVYHTLVMYVSDWWILADKNLTDFAEQYSLQDWAESVKKLVEEGFTVPKIQTMFGTMPAFEVSLRVLKKATFHTPDFIVPLTDLRVPSVEINFKILKNVKIPSRFTTPEFTVLNTFHIPSFTIDLVEIKVKIIRTIDQMMSSELQWPVPEVYFWDLKVNDTLLAKISLPDFSFPELKISEFVIPNLNLKDFEVTELDIPEFQLPHISHTIQVPTFGKLYGDLKIQSPLLTLHTNAAIQNMTTSVNKTEIVASFTAKGESKLEALNFDFQANAQLSDSETDPMVVKESVMLSSKYLKTEHASQVLFSRNGIEGKSDTVARLQTEKNTAELSNNMLLKIYQQFTLDSNTKYFHKLNVPKLKFSSQADLHNQMNTLLKGGHIEWTSSATGSWKWANPTFSDEGTHESQILFTVEGHTSLFNLSNKINSKHLRVTQNVICESGFFNFSKFEIQSKVESQHVGLSVLTAKGTALLGEMKAEVAGNHHASLNGRVNGVLKNYHFFSAQPFEITASTINEGNLKVNFPLKLTGKIDFLTNYALLLNPRVQQANWQASARFNQYKYHQNFSASNNENSMEAHVGMNGEANLDFLNIPLTIPEMTLPYTTLTTPQLNDFSLWEGTGLKEFLKTTKQSFDLNVKAQYKKNKDSHSISMPLDMFYEFVSQSSKSFNKYFEKGKDKTLNVLAKSYSSLHIPNSLRKLSLPEFQVPRTSNNIIIPAMGNITYDFSFKSSVITLNTNVGLYNQSDIVTHFLSSSSSCISALQYKLEGKSSLTRKRGLKLATALSLSNTFVEGSHDSTISLTKKNIEASVTTTAKVQIPILKMNFKQELHGNTKSKPTVSSAVELQYDFDCPKLYTTAKGEVDHKLSLEGLTSYFSIESSGKGDVQGSVLSQKYSGSIASDVNTYLNSKVTRSSVKLQGVSKLDGIFNFEVKENFAGEVTLQRIYATWEHNTKNLLRLQGIFLTSGEHAIKSTLELFPWEMSALVQVRASQPSSLFDIPSFGQEVVLNANSGHQKVIWKSEVQVLSGAIQNNVQLSNDHEEARFEMAGSLEGHLSFLKEIILPVYEKSLWDLLKLDVTTSIDKRQYLRASTALTYTKSPKGYYLSVPVQELANEFIIPGLKLNNSNSGLVIPTFQGPFTNLQVPLYTLDFSEIRIKKQLSTLPFDLNMPILPKIKFPKVDVLTKYTGSEGSSVPSFEVTVPAFQLIVSQFTLPKSISVGSAIWDLNEVANKISTLDLPTITIPEQTVEIPSIKLKVPTGIFIPSFGSLTARFGIGSPLYNTTWSVGLKNKDDHLETFLDATCSSTLQILEYDLNVIQTLKIESGTLVCKIQGAFSHRDFSAEYKEDGKYQGLVYWEGDAYLNIISPRFTDVQLHFQGDETFYFASVSSPTVGTLVLHFKEEHKDALKMDFYYHPPSSPDKRLNLLKTEWIYWELINELKIKANWEEEAASQLLNALKDNVPKATRALYDYVNTYHQEHTGLDLREVSLRLRRSLQRGAERVHQVVIRQIDEVDIGLRKALSSTTWAYQHWKDEAQHLYEDHFQGLLDKLYDSSVQVIQKYHLILNYLVDSLVEFLKDTRFQLPGTTRTYNAHEFCAMVIGEVEKIPLQVNATIQNGLEMLTSFLQDLEEKHEFIKNLKIRFPFTSTRYKLSDVFQEIGRQLKSLSQKIKRMFDDLKFSLNTKTLTHLHFIFQMVFEKIKYEIDTFKNKTFVNLVNDIQHEANSLLSNPVSYISEIVSKNLPLDLNYLNGLVQNHLEVASDELQNLYQYIKALRKEYFDPSVVGWTVKYYELEEKVINLIKNLIAILKDLHSKYTSSATDFAAKLSDGSQQLVPKDIQEYLAIFTDPDGKGKEKVAEISTTAQDVIKSWATAMKKVISDYHQQFRYKLQDLSGQLCDYYEKFITECERLIDLLIENYHMFLQYNTKFLKSMQSNIAKDITFSPGELIITL